VLMSGADALSADAWLKVTSYGGVMYVNPGEVFYWNGASFGQAQTFYYPVGSGIDPVKTNIAIPNPSTQIAIEGLDGTLYEVRFNGATVKLYAYTESGTDGSYLSVEETLCTLPVSTLAHERLSPRTQTHDLTIGYAGASDHGGYLRIVATAEGLSYSVTTAPVGISGSSFVTSPYALESAKDGTAYHAYYETGPVYDPYDITHWHVWGADLSSTAPRGLAGGSGELFADYNVTSLLPVGDVLFYQRDAGLGVQTMVYDGTEARVYADGAVTIQAVD